jgi:hypothetical protein
MNTPLFTLRAIAAVLVLAACGEDAAPPIRPATPVASVTAGQLVDVPMLAAEELVGDYRVAGIDGAPLDEDFGIALSISPVPSTISFDEECGTFRWRSDMEDGMLFTNRLPGERRSCDTPVHPRLLQLAAAIDAADRAARTPANGIVLSGGGRSVLLFSQ